jgi:hypothetical protein
MKNLYKKPNLLLLLSDMQTVYYSCISEIYIVKKPFHFVHPSGKPMIPHSLRLDSYGVCVAKGSQSRPGGTTSPLVALNLAHPRLSLN